MDADGLPPGSDPLFLFVLNGVPGTSYPIRSRETIIGRSVDADIHLASPEVSRRHCCLRFHAPVSWTVEDLHSHWGTQVNGEKIKSGTPVSLQAGDRLHIGSVVAVFGYTPPSPSAVEPQLTEQSPGRLSTGKMLVGGQEQATVPLGEARLCMGRGEEMQVVLADPGVSRQHLAIERVPTGYEATDLRSRAGSFVNGRRFETHRLIVGDQLQVGPFFFRFNGRALERTPDVHSVSVEASHLRKRVGSLTILEDFSLRIGRGQFVAILGPSGAGKTSLLNALIGLRPADSGEVRYDGEDFSRDPTALRSLVGYVPQDDIVHRELTVLEALEYSARLRLPARTPEYEIRKLVAQTISRLGLETRADAPIHRLSGGERKRVNVGVELLARPAVLFLDEPTSGLDPAGEFKMMELLRHLADGGCTVVCTTHVVENVYLADRLFVLTGGRLAFAGSAQEARDYFGVQKLTLLYDRLEEKTPAGWSDEFHRQPDRSTAPSAVPGAVDHRFAAWQKRRPSARAAAALPILLARQWAILRADPKNFLLLFGQPVVIALLVAWATDDAALALFFAYLSTLWFGCSNAAQEIVRELPIYRREHRVGLGRHAYLTSKFILWGGLTALQGLTLYGCLWTARFFLYADPGAGLARGLDGSTLWYVGSLVCAAFAAVGIGFAVSALARSAMQAVMAVPLVLIPQILFSGLVVETNQMSSPAVYALTQAMPSYAAQTMMDVGAFLDRPVTGALYDAHKKAGDHLRDLLLRQYVSHPPRAEMNKGDLRALAAAQFHLGARYQRPEVGIVAALKLVGWMLSGYLVAFFGLRAKERG